MGRVPNVVNALEETRAKYALENGFKEYIHTSQPSRFYTQSYSEDESTITDVWTPIDLNDAKSRALEIVQGQLTQKLSERIIVTCEGFDNGIVYDNDAITNALGLEVGDTFIDAQDGLHELTQQNIDNIRAALKTHREGLYTLVTYRRGMINASTDVDQVEQALNSNP